MIDIIQFIDIKQNLYNYYSNEIQQIKNAEELQKWILKKYFLDMTIGETEVLLKTLHNLDEEIINKYIIEQCEQMTDERRFNIIIELDGYTNSDDYRNLIKIIFETLEDKNKILDIIDKKMSWSDYTQELFSAIDKKIIAEYLRDKNNKVLTNYIINKGEILDVIRMLDDAEKTIFIMNYLGPTSGNVRKNDILDAMIHEVENEYCRKQLIVFVRTEKIIGVEDFKNNISEYQKINEQIKYITDEKDKTDFITNLQDNDLKLEFLKQIEIKENRNEIIKSLTRDIDSRIEPQVELVEKMIREFFEDKNEGSLRKEQKEKLDITFAKTSVMFESLDNSTNGIAHNLEDSISISARHCNNLSKTIMFLLHEYGHIFSLQNIKTENYQRNDDIEEGMQDVFSELVVNHYLEKHKEIKIGDRKIVMEYPCKSYSSYNIENSWVRTMLYPLKEQGKDIEAVTEYLLGSKNKFLELTLGEEKARSKSKDLYGNYNLYVTWQEIYEQMPDGFEKDNLTDSVYGRRNNFMPIFMLQKKFEQTDINFFGLEGDYKYRCTYIADKYFEGKKIYQISRDEMSKFCDLYDSQDEIGIIKYDDFLNKMINELSEGEIEEYSAEILDSSIALARNVIKIGGNLENMWSLALEKERQKVEQGQSVDETVVKYRKFINDYMILFDGKKDDASEFMMDQVKDLKNIYLHQMEESIKSGKVQELLKGLRNNEDGTIYADTDILNLFETLGVKFDQIQIMGSCYTAQDIVDSAIRRKLKLDDIKRMAVILENEKRNELMGERSNGE